LSTSGGTALTANAAAAGGEFTEEDPSPAVLEVVCCGCASSDDDDDDAALTMAIAGAIRSIPLLLLRSPPISYHCSNGYFCLPLAPFLMMPRDFSNNDKRSAFHHPSLFLSVSFSPGCHGAGGSSQSKHEAVW